MNTYIDMRGAVEVYSTSPVRVFYFAHFSDAGQGGCAIQHEHRHFVPPPHHPYTQCKTFVALITPHPTSCYRSHRRPFKVAQVPQVGRKRRAYLAAPLWPQSEAEHE